MFTNTKEDADRPVPLVALVTLTHRLSTAILVRVVGKIPFEISKKVTLKF